MLIKYEKKYYSDTFRAKNVFFLKTLKPITDLKKVLQKKSYFFYLDCGNFITFVNINENI